MSTLTLFGQLILQTSEMSATGRHTGEAWKAVAGESVDAVRAVAALMARLYGAVIDVTLAVSAAESSLTDTRVAVDAIQAWTAVQTRWLHTLVHFQLTERTCIPPALRYVRARTERQKWTELNRLTRFSLWRSKTRPLVVGWRVLSFLWNLNT